MDKWIIRSKNPKLSESSNNDPCASATKSETVGVSSIACNQDETTVCVNTAVIVSSVTQNQEHENGVSYFPNYWTQDQWLEKLKIYEWLTISKQGLGCKICKSVGTLGPAKTQGLKLSSEWCEGRVREHGKTKEKKQQSIRKKLSCHKLSAAHVKASDILSLAKKETIECLNVKTQEKQ